MLDCATQDVASNAIAKDLGNDVIFSSDEKMTSLPPLAKREGALVERLCVPQVLQYMQLSEMGILWA